MSIHMGVKALRKTSFHKETSASKGYLASYLVCQTGVGGDCVLAGSDWLSLNLVECQE